MPSSVAANAPNSLEVLRKTPISKGSKLDSESQRVETQTPPPVLGPKGSVRPTLLSFSADAKKAPNGKATKRSSPDTTEGSIEASRKRSKVAHALVSGLSVQSTEPCSSRKPPTIISIEGNIGSGKSTLMKHLRDRYGSDPTVCFLAEPLALWDRIRDENGATMLEKYYADQTRYAFSFQMMAFVSRLSLLRKALADERNRVIITERSVLTDHMIFAKMLHDEKKIEDVEYKIYETWCAEFRNDIPPIFTVYVRTKPTVALARVGKRARKGEAIPLSYLEQCHDYHERWLLTEPEHDAAPCLNIDGNVDLTEEPEMLRTWLKKIDEFMNKQN